MRPPLALAGMALLTATLVLGPRARAEEYPSFMEQGSVFCTDELDFTAWQITGRFHTRGGRDSCLTIKVLTRVALLNREGAGRAQVRVVSGEFSYLVGYTNAPLPVVLSAPYQQADQAMQDAAQLAAEQAAAQARQGIVASPAAGQDAGQAGAQVPGQYPAQVPGEVSGQAVGLPPGQYPVQPPAPAAPRR